MPLNNRPDEPPPGLHRLVILPKQKLQPFLVLIDLPDGDEDDDDRDNQNDVPHTFVLTYKLETLNLKLIWEPPPRFALGTPALRKRCSTS